MKSLRWAIAFVLALAWGALAPAPLSAHAAEVDDIPLLMIVVGFDGGDNPEAAVAYDENIDWNAALFGPSETPASYFLDVSNGLFTFVSAPETSAGGIGGNTNVADRANDGIVHVTLHRPHGAWGPVNVENSVARDFAQMVMDAMEAAAPYVDFASFDTDGNGILSQQELTVCICVAGYEASSVVDFRRDDIPLTWSHAGLLTVLGQGDKVVDDVRFETYMAIAERYWEDGDPLDTTQQEPLGIVYHELGHALGLPDLYAVTYTEGPWSDYTVGELSLMDSGGWQYADDGNGWRNIPTSLDAWSRYVLGWAKPTLVTASGDYRVSSQWSDTGYAPLLIPTSDPDQYFLVENRQAEGHDVSLEESGLVVWHVDNGMYELYYDANQVNDANHRPCVMCERLDGAIELLLYDKNNDIPDARKGSGISVRVDGAPSRDMVVHVDMDNHEGAMNALHVLDDYALSQLRMTAEPLLLEKVATIVKAVAQ